MIYWDGSNWLPFNIDVNGDIAAMVVYNDMLVAGGCISRVNEINLSNVFAWDGANIIDPGYGYESIHPEDRIDALIIYEETLLVAGGYRFDPDLRLAGKGLEKNFGSLPVSQLYFLYVLFWLCSRGFIIYGTKSSAVQLRVLI